MSITCTGALRSQYFFSFLINNSSSLPSSMALNWLKVWDCKSKQQKWASCTGWCSSTLKGASAEELFMTTVPPGHLLVYSFYLQRASLVRWGQRPKSEMQSLLSEMRVHIEGCRSRMWWSDYVSAGLGIPWCSPCVNYRSGCRCPSDPDQHITSML